MANYWIKAYTEILEDPKMATLPDRLWRRVMELFLLAGKFNDGGNMPETKQLAWVLRMQTDDLDLDLKQIEGTGIIERTPTGWMVVNYAKRQAASPNTERVREYRKRQQEHQYYDNVTQPKRTVTQSQKQIQIQSQKQKQRQAATGDDIDEPAFCNNPISDAFVKASNITPHTLEKWSRALDDIQKTGATPEDVTTAVMELRDKGYNIVGPWSVYSAAIMAKGKRESPPRAARRNGKPTLAEDLQALQNLIDEEEAKNGNH